MNGGSDFFKPYHFLKVCNENFQIYLCKLPSSMNIKHTKSTFSHFKLRKTARLWKNVEWDLAFTCNISVQLVSLKTTSNWAHTELIAFYWNSFVMSPSLMRGNTGGLANEKFLSKSYCFFETIAQWLKNSNFGLMIYLLKFRQHTLLNVSVRIKLANDTKST